MDYRDVILYRDVMRYRDVILEGHETTGTCYYTGMLYTTATLQGRDTLQGRHVHVCVSSSPLTLDRRDSRTGGQDEQDGQEDSVYEGRVAAS